MTSSSNTSRQPRNNKPLIIIGSIGVAVALSAIIAWSIFHHGSSHDSDAARPDTMQQFAPTAPDSAAIIEPVDSNMVENMMVKNENGISFTYTGPISRGLPEGIGRGVYDHGEYNGEYVGGVRQGNAVFVTGDGENRFEGKFKDDFYDEGKLFVADSSYFVGTFKDGDPYDGTWYSPDKRPFATCRAGKTVQ